MNPKKYYWLYVILLEEDKYYVGITAHKDPQTRINEHMNKGGYKPAKWVQRYPYKATVSTEDLGYISKSEAESLENIRTLELMKLYGYQNVRGGYHAEDVKYLKVGQKFIRYRDIDMLLGLALICIGFITLLIRYIIKH